MQAKVIVNHGSLSNKEYFALEISGVVIDKEYEEYYGETADVILRLSHFQYDLIDDPEKLFSQIAKILNERRT